MKIVEFKQKNTKEIYDFVMSVKRDEIGWKKEPEDIFDIESYYLKDGGNFWLALDCGRIVGTLALKDMGSGQGYLKRMYLAKEYRGTGLAEKMLNVLQNFAKEKNIEELYLATTTTPITKRAIAFYKKMGFSQILSLPKNFKEDDDDVFMKIVL